MKSCGKDSVGKRGVFGVFVMDTMTHVVKGHERLCG